MASMLHQCVPSFSERSVYTIKKGYFLPLIILLKVLNLFISSEGYTSRKLSFKSFYFKIRYTTLHIYNILIKMFTVFTIINTTTSSFFCDFFLNLFFSFVYAIGTKSIASFIIILPSCEFPALLAKSNAAESRASDGIRSLPT